MWNKTLGIVLALCSGMVLAAAHQGRGQIRMGGEIMESACAIATDDIWQEIDFGSIALKDIAAGKRSSKIFYIHLLNCALEKQNGQFWKSAQITFNGPQEADNPTLFAMKGEGEGVALQITDESGHQAVAGEALPAVELTNEQLDLKYNLHLVNNGKALSAGELSSLVRFMVTYQ
ncbi:fimbrial protein [Pseudescherichia sp.]|uniref:fimbrial protein n=1 Tax=Pseudescherichia sp. TaxID=2055881 RepID=UPI0028A6906C|nr:fimbrial protein [Pseudescherichia sp.]